jgi:hypothetical protein
MIIQGVLFDGSFLNLSGYIIYYITEDPGFLLFLTEEDLTKIISNLQIFPNPNM